MYKEWSNWQIDYIILPIVALVLIIVSKSWAMVGLDCSRLRVFLSGKRLDERVFVKFWRSLPDVLRSRLNGRSSRGIGPTPKAKSVTRRKAQRKPRPSCRWVAAKTIWSYYIWTTRPTFAKPIRDRSVAAPPAASASAAPTATSCAAVAATTSTRPSSPCRANAN